MASNRKQRNRELIDATLQNDFADIKRLLAAGADPNTRDPEHGETALMLTRSNEATRLLLAAGADVNARDSCYGRTPFLANARRILLDWGADINASDREGQTALMVAVQAADAERVRQLVAWGADIAARDENGNTALSLAQTYGLTGIADLLANSGAQTPPDTRRRSTPLKAQMAITIHRATTPDEELLAVLRAQTVYGVLNALDGPEDIFYSGTPEFFDWQDEMVAPLDTTPCFLVAVAQNKAVGFAALRVTYAEVCTTGPAPVQLVEFHVEDNLEHKQHIVFALMRVCLEVAGQMGGKTLWVEVLDYDRRLQHFYEQLGFSMVCHHIMASENDFSLEDEWASLVMARPLS
jgi:ribosomal protein S18 acetylase RimI-like enzyme